MLDFVQIFFQTVCNHKPHPPKMFLVLHIIAVVHRKREKLTFGAKWGQKNGLVGYLFVKFSKIVLKCFMHLMISCISCIAFHAELISCHSHSSIVAIFYEILAINKSIPLKIEFDINFML